MSNLQTFTQSIKSEITSVFKGKEDNLNMFLAAILAGGHILLEDVPGTGKTVLAKAFSKALGLPFSRIQCTPDLMPSDITGSSVWLPSEAKFEFRKGPVLSSIVLVDELNRATPRTQSALLEAMAEGQVSADGNIYKMDKPFFVIATENPVESEGTFPLPEAQKDRFMLCLSLGYPTLQEEAEIILSQNTKTHPVENVKTVTTKEEILSYMDEVLNIHVDETVLDYMLTLVSATRKDSRLRSGISPRGSIALYKCCQAYAAVCGRDYVTPEDVKKLSAPVFRKRIILTTDSVLRGMTEEAVIADILNSTPIPDFKAHI